MAEVKFIELFTVLNEAVIRAHKALRNEEPGTYSFDKVLKSHQEIYDLCSRDEIMDKLRKLATEKDVTMAKWIQIKTQIDYMATIERDLRQRYRSRLDNYRTGALSKNFIRQSLSSLLLEIESVIK